MSILDIRPTNEYWNMKKRMTKEEPLAILTIKEFPQSTRERTRLLKWLSTCLTNIGYAKPSDYDKRNVRFRLMK